MTCAKGGEDMFADYPRPQGKDECPSELKLDQLQLAELSARSIGAIKYHVSHCARCQRRSALREAGLTAFPKLQSERLLDSVLVTLLGQPETPKPERPTLRWALLAAGVLSVLGTLFLLAR